MTGSVPMDRLFSLDMPFRVFARNTALVSILGLLPLVLLYVALTPGFGGHLAQGGPAMWRFLRQIATNGLPVVFAVNYVAFFLFARMKAAGPGARDPALVVPTDMVVRLGVFILLHAAIYVVSADWFNSFGGSRTTALRVVAPTLARAAMFENLSGVYLYATLLGAVPVYAAAIERSPWLRPLARRVPGRFGAVLLSLAFCALFALILSTVSAALVALQSVG